MSDDRLIGVLVEIRDQQKRQIENFEKAIEGQTQYVELQRKGRQLFKFLVFAPWGALAMMLVYMFAFSRLL